MSVQEIREIALDVINDKMKLDIFTDEQLDLFMESKFEIKIPPGLELLKFVNLI